MQKFTSTCFDISMLITKKYSTSFYFASQFFEPTIRKAIFNIYGFVRLADEIVDSFHQYNKEELLQQFSEDTYIAIQTGISLNPVLHAFQKTVQEYAIDAKHIDAFLKSMQADLNKIDYSKRNEMDAYIHGSAEVVGLMCLRIFTKGNQELYKELEEGAIRLGAAFQKVNFLRDLQNDVSLLQRNYFPQLHNRQLNEQSKTEIIDDIKADFNLAYTNIKRLPNNSKLAVLIAFYYYKALLCKLERTPAQDILIKRVRITNFYKYCLIFKAILAKPFLNENRRTSHSSR